MAQVEPWKKVLVSQEFFETEHGEMDCQDCHGGNPEATGMAESHQGMVADPTFPDPSQICGDCHEEITENIGQSLHYTQGTYRPMVLERASQNPQVIEKIDLGMKNHCYDCHSSCGQCHVSRPDSVEGGFVLGHLFSKKSDMAEQCTACHGSRIGNEYLGRTGGGDVHFTEKQMDCTACHGSELHNAARTGAHDRYDADLPRCEKCHPSDEAYNKVEQHSVHAGKVQCQVCHSQKYANCSACHIGKDSKGLPYYKNPKTVESFKIGINPRQDENHPAKWVLLRRVPGNQNLFDYYVKDALTNFDALPTWKYTTPHSIQRKTFQNRDCNNCHGKTKLFLTAKDVAFTNANRKVLVAKENIPAKIENEKEKSKKKKSYF